MTDRKGTGSCRQGVIGAVYKIIKEQHMCNKKKKKNKNNNTKKKMKKKRDR